MENDDLEYLVELSEAQEIAEQIVIESYLDHLMHKHHRGPVIDDWAIEKSFLRARMRSSGFAKAMKKGFE